MDPIIAVVLSGLVSILVAYLTARQKTKTELSKERAKADIQVKMRQKHDYFHPFKHNADEFRGRLGHIIARLDVDPNDSSKRQAMFKRMQQDFESKTLEWFYEDSLEPPGGYFIASTIYLNCVFFYWIKRIQHEQPFMTLDLSHVGQKEMKAYKNLANEQKFVRPLTGTTGDIYDFTKSMRVAIALGQGIPFGLHDAIGDLVYDQERNSLLNYNAFCGRLLDDAVKVTFSPVLNFWTKLVDKQGNVSKVRIEKIRDLHVILNVLKSAQISDRQK